MSDKLPVTLAALPALSRYRFRPMRREDIPELHAMRVLEDEVDGRTGAPDLNVMLSLFDDPWSDPDKDTLLAIAPGGQIAACARVLVAPEPASGRYVAELEGDVHPAHRGLGLGSAIFQWAQARGAERLPSSANAECVLSTECVDSQADRVALFERHGFHLARCFHRMRRPLDEPIPEPRLPAGLSLAPYRPDLIEALRATYNDTFRDGWGFTPATSEEWQSCYMELAVFRPDLTHVVLDDATGQVVGMSLSMVSAAQNDRQGFTEGWIRSVGVRRAWRKQGLATAMLCKAMLCFRSAGLQYAALGVDSENATGAVAVYERLGFKPVFAWVVYERRLEC